MKQALTKPFGWYASWSILLAFMGAACVTNNVGSVPTKPLNVEQWTLAYEADAFGKTISGNLDTLMEAVKNGHEVRVLTQNDNGVVHVANAEQLWVAGGMVFAQNSSAISATFSGQHLNFVPNTYRFMYILSTDGRRKMARWGLDGRAGDFNEDRVAMKWFIH